MPATAVELALLCDDPDAPLGTWTHWILFNVPATETALPEAVPAALRANEAKPRAWPQGKNDFGKFAYGGPCPPRGTHRYVFRLFALDTHLPPEAGASRKALLTAIGGHILAEGKLVGRYAR